MGKKAFILSLDALIAVVVVILVVGINFYLTKEGNLLPRLQTMRTGSDIIRLVQNQKGFDSLNNAAIMNKINSVLPPGYEMNFNLSYSDVNLASNLTLSGGNSAPAGIFVAAGKSFFVITNSTNITHFAAVTYRIWRK